MGGNTNRDSLWWKTRTVPGRPALSGDLRTEVAIVGAGLTGITAAILLARAGRRVAVIEADQVGGGTTGGTSAHVTQVPDRRYHELLSKFDQDILRRVTESTRAGIERIASFVADEKIDCDFVRIPGYLYTENQKEVSRIEQELEAARKAGLAVTRQDELPLPFKVAAAVRYEDQARFHPLAYLLGLAAAAERAGVQIYEKTRVRGFEGGPLCRIDTDRGTVTAQSLILATHTPVGFNLLQTELEPYRSYVLALRLRGQEPPDGLFWDTDDPYHYTRLQPSERGALLVVGGADHKVGHPEHTEKSYEDLEAYARERWPVEQVVYRWSSQFYEPVDGLPFIGPSPMGENVFVGTGYSGMGMVFATVAGMLLTDQVQGRDNIWADAYRTRRIKPVAAGAEFAKMNLGVARDFLADRIKAPTVHDLGEIAVGEAKVVDFRGDKLAVYRESPGQLHAVSAVCTHLYCLVHWNSAEKTWDCPCHGGRYAPNGEVLEGPPVQPLKPVEVRAGEPGGQPEPEEVSSSRDRSTRA
ncbi:MAG TPA: FAD-dependent oxidoreductase [Thermoanaerobaculia bacterium]|nr:FAD-dependent oxidoreductase [Thermoanaerobaculia bacterium]